MGELLLKKALRVRDRIEKIRRALPADAREILADERMESFIAFGLFLIIQDSIDLATHLIAARGLGVPTSHRESFDTLAKSGLLTRESAEAMAAMASLRNRIAHSYGDLDPVRMVTEAPRGLDAAARFLDEVSLLLSDR